LKIGFLCTSLQLQSIITAHTLNFWILLWMNYDSCLMNALWRISDCTECTNELPFVTAMRPEYKSSCRTVNCPLLFSLSSVVTKCVAILGQRFDFSKHVDCHKMCQSHGNAFIYTSIFIAMKCAFSEPLSSNGLFYHNIKDYLFLKNTVFCDVTTCSLVECY
jgi:hypothetical protein